MESISGDSFITLLVVHHPVSMWNAPGEGLGKDTVPCDKVWNLGQLSNVEPLAFRMFSPESLHEFIQTALSPTHGGDLSPRLNETGRESLADSSCRADNQEMLVWEHHCLSKKSGVSAVVDLTL